MHVKDIIMQQVLISNSLLEVFVGAAYQGKMFRVSIMFYVPYGSIQPIPVQPVYLHELFLLAPLFIVINRAKTLLS